MADTHDLQREFDVRRGEFLRSGLNDTLKWCASPSESVEETRPSDQYWMELFRTAKRVSTKDAQKFIVTFGLQRSQWDYDRAAEAIEKFRNTKEILDTVVSVSDLAETLRSGNKKRHRCESAASKIAMFARPQSDVFIWDSVVTRAARFRDALRLQSQPRLQRRKYSDYASYHKACSDALREEKNKGDFRECVDTLDACLRKRTGPMADRSVCPISFLERRYLDKLMFFEGKWVECKAKARRSKR